MSTISFPNDYEAPESDVLEFAAGEDIDFETSQDDAVVEFSAFNNDGMFATMCPFGYTLNLEEVKILHAFLGDVIAEAEHD